MRVLDRVAFLLRGTGQDASPRLKGEATAERAQRWMAAAEDYPELVGDVLVLGGALHPPALTPDDQLALTELELAYREGKRALALELLALMQITPSEVLDLTE